MAVAAGCGTSVETYTTSVAPLASEDLAASCKYDLRMFASGVPQRGVLVIFDRLDSSELYDDSSLEQLSRTLRFALVLAHQCDGKTSGDIQPNAFAGPGRTLAQALTQFAPMTGHPELANSNLMLFGFSAAGVLAATTANYMPQRVIGVLEYALGSTLDPATLPVPTAVFGIPVLVIANGGDALAGTTPSLGHYDVGSGLGLPWGLAVQHEKDHCCADSTKNLIEPWISAVAGMRLSSTDTLQAVPYSAGTLTHFVCTRDDTNAPTGGDCDFSVAGLGVAPPGSKQQTGWLPDAATAKAWLAWVNNPEGN